MLAQYFQHRGVGKALFVIAELSGNVDAGEYCGLTRRALRPTRNTERGISRNNDAVMDCHWRLITEYGERRCVCQPIERIARPTRTNSQTVDEEEKD